MRTVLAVVTVVFGVACSSGESDPSAAPAPAPSPAPAPTPPPRPSGGTAPTAQSARSGLTRAQRREITAAVGEARGLARRQEWGDALPVFERALAIDPSSARLRCETGFAAFKAGRLEAADRYVTDARRALPSPEHTSERTRVPVAMCLYNAGLVHEARGKIEEARAAFRQSLALRPNATVQARLDALPEAAAAPTSTLLELGGADEAAIVARLTHETCLESGLTEEECADLEHDTEEPPARVLRPTGAQPPHDAFVVQVHVDGGVPIIEEWLVLRSGGAAVAGRVSSRSSNRTAIDDSNTDGFERFEWADVIPGGTPELVLDVQREEVSGDSWQCESSTHTERWLFVCSGDDAFRCARVALASVDSDWWSDDCDDGYPQDEGQIRERGFRVDAELRDGALVIRRATGDPPADVPVGTTPLRDLLAREQLRWHGGGALVAER